MIFIDIKNLKVNFPGHEKPVLKDINIKLSKKDRVLLLGPSGAGKSTLLLALMGIIPRSVEVDIKGDVLLDNISVTKLNPNEVCKKLGLLFQDPESQFCMLYPEDEVAFGLENIGANPKDMPSIIKQSLNSVGLNESKLKNQIDQLSGGQQQRLALSTILAQNPDFLLLDEPTANLDPKGRNTLVSSIEKAVNSGKGLLVVEHNLEPWFPLLNRVIVLSPDGTILDDGEPDKIFRLHKDYLEEIGVWKPKSVKIAQELEKNGHAINTLPLNLKDLLNLELPVGHLMNILKLPKENVDINNSCDAILEMKNVCAKYPRGPRVLNNINLSIKEGEFWALIGENGSGKSTLASTLIGMLKPSSGNISLPYTLAKEIGYVFQNPEHQFVSDTVWGELEYSAIQLKLSAQDRKEKIRSILDFFDLTHLANYNPFTLSGGQKRRLSVATMLIDGKKILILDEPTFGQDERNSNHLMKKISELNKSGVAILMITHDLDLVDTYAHKVAVMESGNLVFSGHVDSLWNKKDILDRCGLELPFRIKLLNSIVERGIDYDFSYQSIG